MGSDCGRMAMEGFPGETILPFLAAFQTTPLHPIDDLYYSGICTEKAGLKIRWSTNHTR
jgi:hypothetical protein